MRVRLITLLYDIRTSYWFVPMCMMIGSIALALAMRWIDESYSSIGLPWTMAASVDDARAIISVVATSVLGVAGVTFSITMVAVSFASSNFGPRLINNFMRDRGSQYTLGTFIGTFVYCLTVLTNVQGSVPVASGGRTDAYVPHLSISIAMLLTFASISMLIYFIHHITETINIENIVANIGKMLQQRVKETFPTEPIASGELPLLEESDFDTAIHGKIIQEVQAGCTGYVQTIDLAELIKIAEKEHLLIRVHYRPGDFTSTHDCLMSIWTESARDLPQDTLRNCFATGQERTEHQNVLFLVEQLSEVIARALSPGINDPFTAITCLNWFRVALMEFLSNSAGKDDDSAGDGRSKQAEWQRSRIQLKPVDLRRLCDTMFGKTRQYVSADRNVTLHTLSLLCECAWQAGAGENRELLLIHMSQLHESSVSSLEDSGESATVSHRYQEALEIVTQTTGMDQIRQQMPWFGGGA